MEEKIYGVYSGSLNKELIDNMPEVELFFAIDLMKSKISKMERNDLL